MASTCMSNCVDARAPVRATYVNLYKWPESDVAFVRSLSLNERQQPKVVDSISCRQLYLRSYTFSRDDDEGSANKGMKRRRRTYSFSDVVAAASRREPKLRGGAEGCHRGSDGDGGGVRRKRRRGFRCVALRAIFRRLLSFTTQVDVVG